MGLRKDGATLSLSTSNLFGTVVEQEVNIKEIKPAGDKWYIRYISKSYDIITLEDGRRFLLPHSGKIENEEVYKKVLEGERIVIEPN